jgi:hypothetical protein
VHSEKTKVMARSQTGHDKLLLGLCGTGFFKDVFNLVKPLRGGHQPPADDPVVRQLAFVRCLHRGNRTRLGGGHSEQLLGAAFRFVAQVKVIADQKEKRLAAAKFPRAEDGMPIAQG